MTFLRQFMLINLCTGSPVILYSLMKEVLISIEYKMLNFPHLIFFTVTVSEADLGLLQHPRWRALL